jgi:hypothetical protein
MDAESIAEFNQLAASSRADSWPVTVTLSSDPASPKEAMECAGTPPAKLRIPDEATRAGYVLQTRRNFSVRRELLPAGASVALGTVFTVTADLHNPATVGTTWSCFELHDSNAGAELVARCFKLD